jgi:hypothetical protein
MQGLTFNAFARPFLTGGASGDTTLCDTETFSESTLAPSGNEQSFQLLPRLFIQSSWHGVRYPKSSDNRTDAQSLVQFKSFGSVDHAIESKPDQP